MRHATASCAALWIILFIVTQPGSSVAAAPATQPTTKPLAVGTVVNERVTAVLDQLETDNDYSTALAALTELWDQVIAYAPDNEAAAFVECDFALRLVDDLQHAADDSRGPLLKFLRANPELAHDLVFLMKPEDKADQVFALLDRLRQKHAKMLEPFATLTTAICLVYDEPLVRNINENQVTAAEPVELFEYFTGNERQMFFGVRGVPAELLMYVVDSTSSIDEMRWAMARYHGNAEVGKLFFDIKYDLNYLKTGSEKQVTRSGFTLPNILKFGGVCADQAYFATSVGKAIGVPTAYTTGVSGEVGHAWVGFLQARGNQGWWNFDTGRYKAYQGVRGTVLDPQTRQEVPDSYVSLMGQLIGTTAAQRQSAAAFTAAAARLMVYQADKKEFSPPPLMEDAHTIRRKPGTDSALALLELGLRQCAGYAQGWFGIRELAKSGAMSLEQKRRWAEILSKLCGERYPDFMLAILAPMVETVAGTEEQNKLWNSAFAMMQRRADLAASVRMSQAEMWAKSGDVNKAGKCYEDVINRYANAGPFVIDALAKTEELLRDSGREKAIPVLYDQTWAKVALPGDMAPEFKAQSNWYRIGVLFAERLDGAGLGDRARIVRKRIDTVMLSATAGNPRSQ